MKRTLILVTFLAALGCDKKPPAAAVVDAGLAKAADVAVEEVKDAPEPAKATGVGKVLRVVDSKLVFHKKNAAEKKAWLHYEAIAGAYLTRARLTGNVDDYVAAGEAIEGAFKVAKEGSGPFFTRAHYNYTVHQLAKVEADLEQVEKKVIVKTDERAQIAGLRGDLAFHNGELAKAREYYEEAIKPRRTLAAVSRLAFLDLKTGNIDGARKGYEEAAELAKSDKAQRAWAMLQRGIVELETGDPKAALEWYEKGNELFTGWYLIEEHIAEAKHLLGDPDGAIELYESIIARSPSGEFMGAMAECYATKGDKAAEQEWLAKAKEAFERDIAKLPSAASGHALEFYLAHDHKRALELARANVALRPNHEARMQLAQALLANGKPDEARKALQPVLDTAWSTPDFFATVALAFDGADKARAEVAAKAAQDLDPSAVSELRATLGLSPK